MSQALVAQLQVRVGPRLLYVGTALTVVGLSVAVTAGPYPLLAFAAIAATVVALAVPPKWLAFGWGVLLPIYGLAGVGATAFDVARLCGAAVIMLRVRSDASAKVSQQWTYPLILLGGYLAVVGLVSAGESPLSGVIIVIGAVTAAILANRSSLHRMALAGFATGGVLSGWVLIMQAMSLPTPALAFEYNGRLPGLSSSAPRASAELALACVVLFMWSRREAGTPTRIRPLVLTGALICSAALVCSGGRTGVAALALALVVAVRQAVIKFRYIPLVAAGVYGFNYIATTLNVELLTINRLSSNPAGSTAAFDVTTGRNDILADSWDAFTAEPLLGPGANAYDALYGTAPHFAPLMFAVAGGLLAAVIACYLYVRLAGLTFGRRRPGHSDDVALARIVAAALLVLATLEPNGPFIGAGLVMLMLIAARTATKEPSVADVTSRPSQ